MFRFSLFTFDAYLFLGFEPLISKSIFSLPFVQCFGQPDAGPNAYSSGCSSRPSLLKLLSLSLYRMDLIRRRSACDVAAVMPSCSRFCAVSQDLFIVFTLNFWFCSRSAWLNVFCPSIGGFALWLKGHSCFCLCDELDDVLYFTVVYQLVALPCFHSHGNSCFHWFSGAFGVEKLCFFY